MHIPVRHIHYLDGHAICRSTYIMSINIHTMYVDRDMVCQSIYGMTIDIHALMFLGQHTIRNS